jgi:hypothetical protein
MLTTQNYEIIYAHNTTMCINQQTIFISVNHTYNAQCCSKNHFI